MVKKQDSQNRSYENITHLKEMSGFIDERMRQGISAISHKISQAHYSYNNAEELPIGEAVANVASEWLESIKEAKEKKVILSVPLNPGRGQAIMDSLIFRLDHLTNKDANIKGDDKRKLEPIWLKIYDLVSKGNYVSEEMSKLLPQEVLEERKEYLSNLKQIVCNSIEGDKKEGIIVERDNAFYCVQCPEESIMTPAKFMNSPEFKDLEYGIFQIGEDDVIRIKDGQYHNMKGKLKMTFKVGDEKIEMTLYSGNNPNFGDIMVYMDNKKSCKIFLEHHKELEKESRISKVVEAAKSFVEKKNGKPLSVLEEVSTSNALTSQQALR